MLILKRKALQIKHETIEGVKRGFHSPHWHRRLQTEASDVVTTGKTSWQKRRRSAPGEGGGAAPPEVAAPVKAAVAHGAAPDTKNNKSILKKKL